MESTKKNKCAHCRKKLGMMAFECKCGKMFCILHKDPEAHNCTYDFKGKSRERLGEQLVKVVADKVTAI